MRFIPHQNAASSVITVTNTATALFTLIDTAGSVDNSQKYFSSPSLNSTGVANGVLITPEDGDIRLGYGITPTNALGTLLSSGTKYFLPNFDLEDVKLIRTSGDVSCSVDIVNCKDGDTYSGVAEAVTIETGSVTIGAVTADITKIGGSTTPASATNGLLVNLGTNNDVTVTGTVTANAGTNLNTSSLALESGGNLATISSDTTDITKALVGIIASPPTIDSLSQVAINLTTGANQVLVSSAANKQIWVYGVTFTCGDADGQTVSFQDEDDTAISGIMEFAQYGGMAHSPSGNFAMPLWKLGTDKDLEVDITGGDVDGFLTYAIVDVS